MSTGGQQGHPYPERILDDYDRIYAGLGDVDGMIGLVGELTGGPARVLDVGTGTGRLALALAGAGHQVTALDTSAPMLTRLAERAGDLPVTVLEADFRTFTVGTTFEAITLSMNTFFMAHSHDDKIRLLDRLRQHLEPDGHVVLDCTDPATFLADASPYTYALPLGPDSFVTVTNIVDRPAQRLTVCYQISDADGVRTFPEVSVWSTPAELDLLARCSGLRTVARYGGYERQEYTEHSRQVITVLAASDADEVSP